MENKMTAVEWLIDQMFKQGYFDGNKPLSITNLDHLQHEAKQMEKEQIMKAARQCHFEGVRQSAKKSEEYIAYGEQYYIETYGKL